MRKVMVLQHVAHEPLGTLNSLLKAKGFRIRYVNFNRHPDIQPSLEKYNGLIILGGPMSVNETKKHPHLKIEMKLIEEALTRNIPVLGICLGSQMLAHVLGSEVRRAKEKEIGWCDVHFSEKGRKDPMFNHFQKTEKIFQWHSDTFDVPRGAHHLASSALCESQAFRFGEKAYGLQFHLEVDGPMIHRWLKVPSNQEELMKSRGKFDPLEIELETQVCVERSLKLSHEAFDRFHRLFGLKERPLILDSGHGKPRKAE